MPEILGKSGFFNSSENTKKRYTDLDFGRMLSLLTGGQGFVPGYLNELEVVDATSGSELKVTVKSGAGWIGVPEGWWYINDSEKTFNIASEDSAGTDRIDRVVVVLDRTTEKLETRIELKQGESDSAPTPYTLKKDDFDDFGHIYEISLAQIYITGGSSTLMITDERSSIISARSRNVQKTLDFTLSLADSNSFILCNNATSIEVTLPSEVNVSFTDGTDITLFQEGAGQITVKPASGVTIYADGKTHSGTSDTFKSNTRHSAITLRKVGENTWIAVGSLTSDMA